jgi:hypothetical protein
MLCTVFSRGAEDSLSSVELIRWTETAVRHLHTYRIRANLLMRVMAVRDDAARDKAIIHTPEFIRFGVEYREVVQ